jgi:pathogenesis-related protein 1
MDAERAVGMWAGEVDEFTYSPAYEFDPRSGHYSQIVWRKTTHIGCGRAHCGRDSVVVCRYSPAGNRIGRAPY